ncbi:MAG: adenylate/guanylate cyclase domain-containing protein [Mesorhizobium sp.]|nr:adenylate/guanylate cyclase domain-containing protein [Mesorhizobium sp.]MBL8575778.1 adenylate/guanylate cyclase domain-containing protein [Mesorhizobium sp.]
MRRWRLHILVAIVLSGLWGGFLGATQLKRESWLVERAEATLVDLRTLARGIRNPAPNVLIVAIDDETVRQEGKFPVSRATLARVVDTLATLGPKVIGLDILLIDTGNEADDALLAAALDTNRTVIAAAAVFGAARAQAPDLDDPAFDAVPVADSFVFPNARFASGAAIGVVNLATDFAGTPRYAPLIFRTSHRIEASFPLQATSLAFDATPMFQPGGVVLGDRTIATDIGQRMPISYYGPRGTIETVSAASVLAGQLQRQQVEGRVVVIGATVIGNGDVFPSPFDPVLPGVEVISSAISNILSGDGLVRDGRTRLADAGIAVVLPMLLVALLAWRRSLLGLLAISFVLAIWLGTNFTLFSRGIWLSAALPLAAALPPAMLFGVAQIWFDRHRSQGLLRQNESLQRLQSPVLREWMARDPDFLAKPVRQEAAMVFIDLSGFTGLSETTSVTTVRELLDDFYRLVEQEASPRGGVITSFMGDGAMIVFGLPQATPQDPANALDCAMRLASLSRQWLADHPVTRAGGTGIKLGAHCGSIVASRLGGGSQQTITATGDAVNVASRLMDVAAQHKAELAVSADLYRAGGEALASSGNLEGPMESPIRGRTGTMTVWLWREAK